MGKTTGIEWTDATWNPWQGCKKVSAGCKNCYMYRDMNRFGKDGSVVFRSAPGTFNMPLKGRYGKGIPFGSSVFTCSWSDFFIEEADAWRDEALEIIRKTPHYFYIILTKRPENIEARLPKWWLEQNKNVALLVSAEDQKTYDERWPILADIPAAVRGISMEPMLGPINLASQSDKPFPDWIITGGESGPGCRYPGADSFRLMAGQCVRHGIPHFHKQNGGTKKIDGSWGGDAIDGMRIKFFPKAIMVHKDRYT